jgi:REP element-mobilizing transposase RayT
VQFTGRQAKSIAEGFAYRALQSKIVICACAILPDHVHLVFSRHRVKSEQIMNQLKGAATYQLEKDGLHPFAHLRKDSGKYRLPSVWAVRGWLVYIDNPDHLQAAVRYVENNPVKAGYAPQRWKFVVPM